MSLLRPAYRISIGGQRVASAGAPLANTVTGIEVSLGLGPMAADQAVIRVGRVGELAPAPDDEAVIELGYADEGQEVVQVMRGTAFEVLAGVTAERVICLGAAAGLGRRRVAETFREKRAEEIVRSLAGDAGVGVARTGTSPVLPYYVVDPGRSVLRHMADLAELVGFDLYCNEEGELVFEPFGAGRQVLPLAWRADVLDFRVERRPPEFASVEAFGESPGSGAGEQSWSWLTKDFAPRKGSAGTGAPALLLERSALRTAEAAQTAADAARTELTRRRLGGSLRILGAPGLRIGDAVRLSEMPEDDLNATFQVRRIRHRIDKTRGFVTDVWFRSAEAAA